MTAWYCEHLRSYQLHCNDVTTMCVVKLSELNDVLPLSAYRVQGELMVTLRRLFAKYLSIIFPQMAVQQKLTMRVIVSEGDIRKMTMTTRPDTLEDLIGWLKGTLQTNYSFTLQYQDPEFHNELCNLTDLSELPEKPTIKIIPMIELVPITAQPELRSD